MNHVTKQNQLFWLDSQNFCFCVWQQLFHTERTVLDRANLCHKVKGKEWANVHICVISAVIRLNPIHGNELVEQMESLKVIENDAARTVVLVSGLKAGRLASSCLKFKDLSVKFK